ncbi:MAG TPA: SDR family oxidoreductase [Opitutaceae bacterium]|nr:SDR family oxidoreductase [Opitutaceae bacterium]
MRANFSGQVVWITGASSGIGEALALGFARAGARLVLSSRRAEELERVRRACARPDDHFVLPLDLARSETFATTTAEVRNRCGAVDMLVNNAGVAQRALATDATPEVERALMEVNYFGPVALTKAVLPAMRARRRGHVVVISSVLGHFGFPGNSTYSAAKHALHGYFDSLRAEIWREGIKITLVSPGYVKTAVSANALGPRGEKSARPSAARGLSPERCAAAILRGVARGRENVYLGGPEVAAVYLMRFAPWLFSQLVRRMKPRAHET